MMMIVTAVFTVSLLLFVLVIFLDVFEKKETDNTGVVKDPKKRKETSKGKTVRINTPTIYVYEKGNKKPFMEASMTETPYLIGREESIEWVAGKRVKTNLVISRPCISHKQMYLYEKLDKKSMSKYYVLVNLSTSNSTEYLNKDKSRYEILRKNEKIELGCTDIFWVGDIKIKIVTPKPRVLLEEDLKIIGKHASVEPEMDGVEYGVEYKTDRSKSGRIVDGDSSF